MFDYLKYKLTGKVPNSSRLLRIAERYGWLEPEIRPAAWYIVALARKGTELRAFWNYKKRNWVIRIGDSEVDRGVGFGSFVSALKAWRRENHARAQTEREASP
jgi:hypothetical protein